MTTFQRIQDLSRTTAKRFARMHGAALAAANAGLARYFGACDRINVEPELSVVREILDLASDRKFGKRQKATPQAA